jgi:hypothetical protein
VTIGRSSLAIREDLIGGEERESTCGGEEISHVAFCLDRAWGVGLGASD